MIETIGRPVPGARVADRLALNGQSFLKNLNTLTRGLKRARKATESYSFDRQIVHELGLTVIGGIVLLAYSHFAQHFGLSPTSEVILAASVSGSGKRMDMNAPIVPPDIIKHNKEWGVKFGKILKIRINNLFEFSCSCESDNPV